ncbi:hypothetical protein V8C86DRAFT_2530647 [Haematococcus lacustris]
MTRTSSLRCVLHRLARGTRFPLPLAFSATTTAVLTPPCPQPINTPALHALVHRAQLPDVLHLTAIVVEQLPLRTTQHLQQQRAILSHLPQQCQAPASLHPTGGSSSSSSAGGPLPAALFCLKEQAAAAQQQLVEVVESDCVRKAQLADAFAASTRSWAAAAGAPSSSSALAPQAPQRPSAPAGLTSATAGPDLHGLGPCAHHADMGQEVQRVKKVLQAAGELRTGLEAEADRLASELQRLTEGHAWWSHAALVAATDQVMDGHESWLLAQRLLLSELTCCWERWQHSQRLQGLSLGGEEDSSRAAAARWSMAGPLHPPPPPSAWKPSGPDQSAQGSEQGQRPSTALSPPPASLLLPDAPLAHLLTLAVEDVRAFCIEKNSTAPAVEVSGGAGVRPLVMDAYVQYIYGEMLKNAMSALINKWGAWDVDEADPVSVIIAGPHAAPSWLRVPRAAISPAKEDAGQRDTAASEWFTVTITDTGGGMAAAQLEHSLHYFATSHASRAPQYGYSREHGAQFHGKGVGMPLSRAYARFMGGDMRWDSDQEQGGTTVTLCLPCNGFTF